MRAARSETLLPLRKIYHIALQYSVSRENAQNEWPAIDRRKFLRCTAKIGAALAACSAPYVFSRRAFGATAISFASYGGSYGDFVQEYWIKPFTAETGISVQYVNGPDLAKVKAQVDNKSVEWDVFDATGSVAYAGVDPQVLDPSRFVQQPDNSALVPSFIYTGGIGYDPARTKSPARDFAQLWDVGSFPGPRGLSNTVSENLERALLAGGVPASALYPLDIDRGFKLLDAIKPHVKQWYEATAQGITLIQTKEADYTYTFANRVKAAKASGVSIDFSFDQCISSRSYYTIPRGGPRKGAAMRFLEYVTRLSSRP
ncbi:extracellular solute-binding protein [Bradyrhizobium arachidis]|uniref:extracellular solute-binding protein n=1 Tax=Bradyrhizobium arachidis TaxID=858423 RepID=UPI00216199B2|nr:extracellular solute-binding protein [Bradyrhizobium arachidis]UVO30469.1 extracellular solute-binding protein [Bradyrhizobium arachidis]